MGQKPEYRPIAIKIFSSRDEGRTWRYLSEIRCPNKGGLWEPEFTLGRDDALIMFFSDETDQARYSQTIRKVRTYDGVNWRDIGYVIVSDIRRDRPGMLIVRLLSDGQYMITDELDKFAQFIVHYRLSHEGGTGAIPRISARKSVCRMVSSRCVHGPALSFPMARSCFRHS